MSNNITSLGSRDKEHFKYTFLPYYFATHFKNKIVRVPNFKMNDISNAMIDHESPF